MKINVKKKSLFWFIVPKVTVHHQLAALLLGLRLWHSMQRLYGGEQLVTSWQPGNRKKEGLGIYLTKAPYSSDLLPPTRSHILKFPPALNSATAWGQPPTHKPLIQNIAIMVEILVP